MIKKGIILAGGVGSRMSPLTKAVNKQLLPLYDKPLFFYPLSILMLSKIKDVLIIVNKDQIENFKKILPNGNNLGMNIKYIEQKTPKGLPDAFILGEKFINNQPVALILGDNFFYGQNLTKQLLNNGNRSFYIQIKYIYIINICWLLCCVECNTFFTYSFNVSYECNFFSNHCRCDNCRFIWK